MPLNDTEKRILQRLKDDFEHYAPRCLKIRSKSGQILPFTLNKAQAYIHARIEQQRRELGYVRAIVLKGRQQGCCFTPKMRVLTADYRWKMLDEIQIGEKLVACDEESPGLTQIGRKQSRKFKTAIVEDKREFYKPVYGILLDNGAKIEVTGDHRMLCKKRGGDDQQWRYVQDLKINDFIRVAMRPPGYECETYEDGWMAGIIDGEGSCRRTGAPRISIHQVDGPVLHRMKAYFANINMPYKEVIDSRGPGQSNKLGRKPVHRLDIHRLPYLMELLARCRPTRFTNEEWHIGHELPGKGAKDGIKPWAKVIGIFPLEARRVIDLQTSEKTYICEGLVSHNSTYIEGRFYWKVTHRFGVRAFILTHEEEATKNLFEMARRYYDNCPEIMRPRTEASNARELVFAQLDSGYRLGTAGNKAVGRSSTIQYLHGSEVAYWANAAEHAKGIFQAVPHEQDTEIILESTANGVGNYFHEQWQLAESGMSEFIPIFVPWYWQDEYVYKVPEDFKASEDEQELMQFYGLTDGQLMWRRVKINELSVGGMDGAKAFMSEYPNTATEAFIATGEDIFIDAAVTMRARKAQVEAVGPLLVGVDPARFGDDRSAIIMRQGRLAYGLRTYVKKDTMEIAGIVHKIIEDMAPAKVFVDVVGVGAGVVDRLNELGHRSVVVAVSGGAKPLDTNRYINKRAEMWGNMREWLIDEPVQIPDSDELHADLCGVTWKVDSKYRIALEKKEDMKKRGLRSSDTADALALTFAYPSSATLKLQDNHYKSVAKSFAGVMNRIDKLKKAAYKH